MLTGPPVECEPFPHSPDRVRCAFAAPSSKANSAKTTSTQQTPTHPTPSQTHSTRGYENIRSRPVDYLQTPYASATPLPLVPNSPTPCQGIRLRKKVRPPLIMIALNASPSTVLVLLLSFILWTSSLSSGRLFPAIVWQQYQMTFIRMCFASSLAVCRRMSNCCLHLSRPVELRPMVTAPTSTIHTSFFRAIR